MGLRDWFRQLMKGSSNDTKPVAADYLSVIRRESARTIVRSTNTQSFEFNSQIISQHRMYMVDSIVKQTVQLYTEMQMTGGFRIVSKDPQVQKRVNDKFKEIEQLSGISMYKLIREAMRHFIQYGNQFFVFKRNNKATGRPYVYNGKELLPISSIHLQHPATMTVLRNQQGDPIKYKQDLSLLQREFSIWMKNPETNLLLGISQSPYTKELPQYDVAHFKYDEDLITGFGRPFYFETLDDLLLMRDVERTIEELVMKGRILFALYRVGNDRYPTTSQKQIEDQVAMLETTEPFGIIVAPHNHDIEVRSADNLINSLVNFYDRIRHRVYGALGISSIMMGETGQSNKASASEQVQFAYNKARDFQKLFQAQFNSQVLEHIIACLGYSPLKLGDAKPELEFGDPDLDMLIKQQNNTVFLFEHNAITFEEMRNQLGLSPNVNEDDLYVSKIGTLRAKARETENRVMPKNQWTERR